MPWGWWSASYMLGNVYTSKHWVHLVLTKDSVPCFFSARAQWAPSFCQAISPVPHWDIPFGHFASRYFLCSLPPGGKNLAEEQAGEPSHCSRQAWPQWLIPRLLSAKTPDHLQSSHSLAHRLLSTALSLHSRRNICHLLWIELCPPKEILKS